MWIEGEQSYNKFVWEVEEDSLLKDVILNEMNISVRLLSALKKAKNIFVNGKRRNVTENVSKGDIVKIFLIDENSEYRKQNNDINILYEDEDILIVDKPYDMVVHPTAKHLEDTMLNYLLYYFDNNNIKSKVRFVNRLDRYTSGILIVAKNAYAHHFLTRENLIWDIEKEYIAVVEGKTKDKDTINKPIAKSEDGIRREINSEGKEAITHYETLVSNDEASLVKIKLETGRTHQIRVHMSSEGHRLYGDELYEGNVDYIKRQALHSSRLGFYSPRKKEKIYINIKLPNDIRELIEILFNFRFDIIN